MTIILGYRETGLTMMEKDIVVARLVAHAILLDQILRSRLSKQLCLATDNPCSGRTREVTEDCHVFSFLLEVSSGIIMMEDQSQAQKKARRDDLIPRLQAIHPEINIRRSFVFRHFLPTSYTHTRRSLGPEGKPQILEDMAMVHQYSPPPESDHGHEHEDHHILPLYSERRPLGLHHRPSFLDEIVPLPSPSHFTPVGKDPRTHALRRSASVAIISIFLLAVIFMASTESGSTAKEAAVRLKGVFGIESVAELGEAIAANLGLGDEEQSTNTNDEGLAAETEENSSTRPQIGE